MQCYDAVAAPWPCPAPDIAASTPVQCRTSVHFKTVSVKRGGARHSLHGSSCLSRPASTQCTERTQRTMSTQPPEPTLSPLPGVPRPPHSPQSPQTPHTARGAHTPRSLKSLHGQHIVHILQRLHSKLLPQPPITFHRDHTDHSVDSPSLPPGCPSATTVIQVTEVTEVTEPALLTVREPAERHICDRPSALGASAACMTSFYGNTGQRCLANTNLVVVGGDRTVREYDAF